MEIVLVIVLAAIGGAILRVNQTLGQINQSLKQLVSADPASPRIGVWKS